MPNEDAKTILIVDDDITIRKLLGFHLRQKEYKVIDAGDTDQAFKALEEMKIDLVLCDVSMEGMDGYTFCGKVRENEKYRVLPFIFVTAKSSFEDKEKALAVGGDDIITKPFVVPELLLKVQALLRRADIYKAYGAKKNIQETIAETVPKIVLVDDDISLAKLFQYNLNKSGFKCEIASGAEEGFTLARSVMPDVIISDIMMPKIDGFQFRAMVMDDNDLKSVPFIFLTSKGAEDDILKGYDLGIADYVLKTAGPRVVVAKVNATIKSLGKVRQRVVSELQYAADSMKVKVVPDASPSFPGFEIKHWHQTFSGIPGGDFIDYFPLDDDNIAIILGDVMGKKWGAWYFAIAYAGYVRSSIRVALQNASDYTPSVILTKVNQLVYQDAKISEVFTTLSVIILNNKTKTAKYSGAGDLPVIYKNTQAGTAELIQSKGMLLGFSSNGFFEDKEINLNQNDMLVLFTDGIIESRNKDGNALEATGLVALVQNLVLTEDPLSLLKNQISTYTDQKFEDDTSLITILSK